MSLALRIERLCRRYTDGELDDLVVGDEQVALLDRILTAVRDGAQDHGKLAEDLDALEQVAHDSGLAGLTKGPRVYYRPPASVAGHPVAHVMVCPNQTCSRSAIDYGAAERLIECAINARPLTRIRLDL